MSTPQGLVRKAGFTKMLAWHQPAVYTEAAAEEYAATLYAAPNRRDYVMALEEEVRGNLHEKLIQLLRGKLEDAETPLQLDGLLVIASKV